MSEELDCIVIGSGPGGYVAAIRAGQLGMRVAVVEKDPKLGGTCLHRGCIPTKALLHSASLFDQIKEAGRFGVDVGNATLDGPALASYRTDVVDKNARGIEYLFKKNNVETLHGFGRLVGPQEVEIEGPEGVIRRRAKNVLLATGSVPRALPFAPWDGLRILNSDHILELDRVPDSLVVLGGGAVGVEFASIFASFGARVALVEMLPRLLPVEDEEVSKELSRVFKKRGIEVHTDTRLEQVDTQGARLRLDLTSGSESLQLETELLLVAVGRSPVVEKIGLETVGVELEGGYIGVDELQRTSVPNIYAIGDVIDTPWLAHVASAEGVVAVEQMAGLDPRPVDYDRVPSCTYCEPEVASVGLTEAQARERGFEVEVGKFPFTASGKAAILGRTEGFVKVVRETRYDELLGVHIIGAHATDLIAEACVALQIESTAEEIFRTMHAHPTLSEALAEAALAATGRAVHA